MKLKLPGSMNRYQAHIYTNYCTLSPLAFQTSTVEYRIFSKFNILSIPWQEERLTESTCFVPDLMSNCV